MRGTNILAVLGAVAGGFPPFPRGKRRRRVHPDPARESAAAAKRARKAAKRASDAERTADGRVSRFCGGGIWFNMLVSGNGRSGLWDGHASIWRIHYLHPKFHGPPKMREPRWRERLTARRETGPNGLPWWVDLAWWATRKRALGPEYRRMVSAQARWGASFNACLCQRLDIEDPGPHTRACETYPARCPECDYRDEAELIGGSCESCTTGIYEDARVRA